MNNQSQIIEEQNYRNDYRVRALEGRKMRIDLDRMVALIEIDDDDEPQPTPVRVPIKFEICGVCGGKGTHVNPSIDCGGLSREDFDDDPDFERDYFGGAYDVQCGGCGGKRVEPMLDRDAALTAEQERAIKYFDDLCEDDAGYAAECEAERRAGC